MAFTRYEIGSGKEEAAALATDSRFHVGVAAVVNDAAVGDSRCKKRCRRVGICTGVMHGTQGSRCDQFIRSQPNAAPTHDAARCAACCGTHIHPPVSRLGSTKHRVNVARACLAPASTRIGLLCDVSLATLQGSCTPHTDAPSRTQVTAPAALRAVPQRVRAAALVWGPYMLTCRPGRTSNPTPSHVAARHVKSKHTDMPKSERLQGRAKRCHRKDWHGHGMRLADTTHRSRRPRCRRRQPVTQAWVGCAPLSCLGSARFESIRCAVRATTTKL